jgi:hypothetical protein
MKNGDRAIDRIVTIKITFSRTPDRDVASRISRVITGYQIITPNAPLNASDLAVAAA